MSPPSSADWPRSASGSGWTVSKPIPNVGLWDGTDYAGNSHTAQETRQQAYSWGLAIGTAIFEAHPSSKILIYSWHPPGGWEDTFVYGQKSAKAPLTYFWMGYLEAMANHGNADARMVVTDAFFYKPLPQVTGALLANALKYHTQGSIAWLSRNLAPGVWNKVCDRIDMSLFSWAGTDSNDAKFYKHTGEPAFADQLSLFRRYAMGTRRANYTYEGSPDRYCWIDHTHPAKEEPAGGFDQANNWYVIRRESGPNHAPGGHLPGITSRSATQADRHHPTDAQRKTTRQQRRRHLHGHRLGAPPQRHQMRPWLHPPKRERPQSVRK